MTDPAKFPRSLYRERFARTLAHQPVDRPPMDLASTDMTQIEGGPRRLAPGLGLTPSASEAETDEAVLRALDTDIRGVGGLLFPASPRARHVSPEEVVDCWGITSRWNGHHYEMVGHPLAGKSIDDLARYPWPAPEALSRDLFAAETRRMIRILGAEGGYILSAAHTFKEDVPEANVIALYRAATGGTL